MKEQIKSHEAKMRKRWTCSQGAAAVRAGRANPAVLDKITVEYYGAPTPLNQVAISAPDPRTLAIQPWDGSVLKAIERRSRSRPRINQERRQADSSELPADRGAPQELIKGLSGFQDR